MLSPDRSMSQAAAFPVNHFLSEIKDTINSKATKPHPSPKSAMMRSLLLPGWGQIANRQYWKLPVLYGGFAATAYAIKFAKDSFTSYRQAYILRTDGDSSTVDKYNPVLYPDNVLKSNRDY